MIFLIDTNVFADLLRKNPKSRARFVGISVNDEARIRTTVRGEILFGIVRVPIGKRQAELRASAGLLFNQIPCESLSESMAATYSQIKFAMEKKGTPVAENDLWIAACALDLNATLVTRDRVFNRIEGLTIEDWSI